MAAREAFVDTSILYALVDKRDAHHAAARVAVEALLRSNRQLLTTNYIVTEAVNLANARGGAHVALRILELIDRSAGMRLEWIGALRFEETKAYFRKVDPHVPLGVLTDRLLEVVVILLLGPCHMPSAGRGRG